MIQGVGLVVTTVLAACSAGGGGPAPGPPRPSALSGDVGVLLEHSMAEETLGGFRADVEAALDSLGVDRTPAMRAALDRHYSVAALLPVMAREMEALGDSATLARAADLVSTGAIARTDSIIDAAPPPVPLDEYVRGMRERPPTASRARLVARLTAAQGAGDFYVMLSEQNRRAAHVIAGAVREDIAEFRPISARQRIRQSQRYFRGALFMFFRRYDAVPEEDLEAGLAAWTSEAGVWFVEAYSGALARTGVAAARAVARELGGR